MTPKFKELYIDLLKEKKKVSKCDKIILSHFRKGSCVMEIEMEGEINLGYLLGTKGSSHE